jgi:glycosyltransferase involved in cell wall biosynthesis
MVGKSSSRIIFTGYVGNDQLYRFYEISDVAIVPSTWEEPAGLVVLEAAAAGKPIIVTRSGGIPEYFNPKSGIMIENDDNIVDSLVKSIVWMRENCDEATQMGLRGAESVKEYDKSVYLNNFSRAIDEILH